MITLIELLKNTKLEDVSNEHQKNLDILLERMNVIRAAYGKPMSVTSGYRSMAEHLRIYKEKGITDKTKIPMKSRHLFGEACDISDPKGILQTWCKVNIKKLEEAKLWCEDFNSTPGWCHFQTVAPKSGKRFFIP